jgi:hypothetical protein
MVLPLIPLIGLGFFVTWLVLYGMTHGLQTWLASLLNALAHPQGSFWKVAALKAVGAIVGAAAYVFRAVGHAISQAAAHGTARVAHYFGGITVWLTQHAIVAGDFAEATALGFERLVAHTIPHVVARAIAVPLHEVRVGLRHTEAELAQLRRYARGIDTLVRDTIIPDIRRLAHAIDITLPRALGKVRARVGRAERSISHPSKRWIKAVWKAGFVLVGAGLMLKFLVKKFPHLFCRNVTKTAKALCSPRNNLLVDLLLGEAIAAFVIADMCTTVKAIEVVAEGFEPLLRELVTAEDDFFDWCGNDLPSAHDTPGYGGPWLATTL